MIFVLSLHDFAVWFCVLYRNLLNKLIKKPGHRLLKSKLVAEIVFERFWKCKTLKNHLFWIYKLFPSTQHSHFLNGKIARNNFSISRITSFLISRIAIFYNRRLMVYVHYMFILLHSVGGKLGIYGNIGKNWEHYSQIFPMLIFPIIPSITRNVPNYSNFLPNFSFFCELFWHFFWHFWEQLGTMFPKVPRNFCFGNKVVSFWELVGSKVSNNLKNWEHSQKIGMFGN